LHGKSGYVNKSFHFAVALQKSVRATRNAADPGTADQAGGQNLARAEEVAVALVVAPPRPKGAARATAVDANLAIKVAAADPGTGTAAGGSSDHRGRGLPAAVEEGRGEGAVAETAVAAGEEEAARGVDSGGAEAETDTGTSWLSDKQKATNFSLNSNRKLFFRKVTRSSIFVRFFFIKLFFSRFTGRYRGKSKSRSRSPEQPLTPEERDARTVFIMQLSQRVRSRDVEEFFSAVGKIRDVKLIVCNKTRRFKGIAYVEFKDIESVPLVSWQE
jgi:hypothetical protein